MGFNERVCQLCGIPFNIGRVRRPDEPPEAAWDGGRSTYVSGEHLYEPCTAKSCEDVARSDGPDEHIAGPDCDCTQGYSGWRITVAEMRDCTAVQCLSIKTPEWRPEPGDEEFEVQAEHCFVTGICPNGTEEFEVDGLSPVKHGISSSLIANQTRVDYDDGEETALPMHPKCFEMFKKLSLKRLGKIDIDGLWLLREDQGAYENRFEGFPRPSDLDIVLEQWYCCRSGTEYLVANPVNVPGLNELIDSCVSLELRKFDEVFITSSLAKEPFAVLSPEIRLMLLELVSRQDAANLRLASPCFRQLPQNYFQYLVHSEMPWVWEVEPLRPRYVDWYHLWDLLFTADGNGGMDEKERAWKSGFEWARHGLVGNDLQLQDRSYSDEDYEPRREAAIQRANIDTETKIKEGYDSGIWPARTDKILKGLRNRRRIHGDVQEILRRIEELNLKAG